MPTSEFNWREFPGKKGDGPANCPRFAQHDKPQAQPKPLTAERIDEIRKSLMSPNKDGNIWLDEITDPQEILALISMLTPPPAPCRHCGGSGTTPADDGHGLRSCVCCKGTGEQPNFTDQPAPAPLPENIKWAMRELNAYAAQNPGTPLGSMYATISAHITDLTRRLAEVEAERDALLKREDLLERTLDDKWRTRKYIVCREYQLVDMMYITMTVMDWYDAEKARAEAAEAKVQRIMAWARKGTCSTCDSGIQHNERGCGTCVHAPVQIVGAVDYHTGDNWAEPKEWEGGE